MNEVIQRYDHNTKSLEQPFSYKVKKLLELGCITKIKDGYSCAPIVGYNKTTYTIHYDGELKCNCQGFGKRGDCSHVKAAREYRDRTEGKKQMEVLNEPRT